MPIDLFFLPKFVFLVQKSFFLFSYEILNFTLQVYPGFFEKFEAGLVPFPVEAVQLDVEENFEPEMIPPAPPAPPPPSTETTITAVIKEVAKPWSPPSQVTTPPTSVPQDLPQAVEVEVEVVPVVQKVEHKQKEPQPEPPLPAKVNFTFGSIVVGDDRDSESSGSSGSLSPTSQKEEGPPKPSISQKEEVPVKPPNVKFRSSEGQNDKPAKVGNAAGKALLKMVQKGKENKEASKDSREEVVKKEKDGKETTVDRQSSDFPLPPQISVPPPLNFVTALTSSPLASPAIGGAQTPASRKSPRQDERKTPKKTVAENFPPLPKAAMPKSTKSGKKNKKNKKRPTKNSDKEDTSDVWAKCTEGGDGITDRTMFLDTPSTEKVLEPSSPTTASEHSTINSTTCESPTSPPPDAFVYEPENQGETPTSSTGGKKRRKRKKGKQANNTDAIANTTTQKEEVSKPQEEVNQPEKIKIPAPIETKLDIVDTDSNSSSSSTPKSKKNKKKKNKAKSADDANDDFFAILEEHNSKLVKTECETHRQLRRFVKEQRVSRVYEIVTNSFFEPWLFNLPPGDPLSLENLFGWVLTRTRTKISMLSGDWTSLNTEALEGKLEDIIKMAAPMDASWAEMAGIAIVRNWAADKALVHKPELVALLELTTVMQCARHLILAGVDPLKFNSYLPSSVTNSADLTMRKFLDKYLYREKVPQPFRDMLDQTFIFSVLEPFGGCRADRRGEAERASKDEIDPFSAHWYVSLLSLWNIKIAKVKKEGSSALGILIGMEIARCYDMEDQILSAQKFDKSRVTNFIHVLADLARTELQSKESRMLARTFALSLSRRYRALYDKSFSFDTIQALFSPAVLDSKKGKTENPVRLINFRQGERPLYWDHYRDGGYNLKDLPLNVPSKPHDFKLFLDLSKGLQYETVDSVVHAVWGSIVDVRHDHWLSSLPQNHPLSMENLIIYAFNRNRGRRAWKYVNHDTIKDTVEGLMQVVGWAEGFIGCGQHFQNLDSRLIFARDLTENSPLGGSKLPGDYKKRRKLLRDALEKDRNSPTRHENPIKAVSVMLKGNMNNSWFTEIPQNDSTHWTELLALALGLPNYREDHILSLLELTQAMKLVRLMILSGADLHGLQLYSSRNSDINVKMPLRMYIRKFLYRPEIPESIRKHLDQCFYTSVIEPFYGPKRKSKGSQEEKPTRTSAHWYFGLLSIWKNEMDPFLYKKALKSYLLDCQYRYFPIFTLTPIVVAQIRIGSIL